jgi:flagellar basal-body rod protein FlgB
MIPDLFSHGEIPVLEQVINFSQARHNLLAGNIANLDTPGYRTRDLPPAAFEAKLKEAIEASRRQEMAPEIYSGEPNTDLDSMATMHKTSPFVAVKDSLGSILRHDDGNVGMEQQIAELSKNQMQHNLAVNILASQFRLLQAASSERA